MIAASLEISPVLSLLSIGTSIVAYLLGSIPTGFLMARSRGIDIRAVGSGNIGATNAFRILGKGPGTFVLLVDAAKGWSACAGLPWLASYFGVVPTGTSPAAIEGLSIISGFMAVLGHNYTCWLGFKGGKGIATSAGVLVALVPWALLIVLITFLVVFWMSRYVSLGSISAAFVLPFATWWTHCSMALIGITTLMSVLAIYKHRANIQRLRAGTENRVGWKPKAAR